MGFPPLDREFLTAARDQDRASALEQQMQATGVVMGVLDEHQVSSILALALARIHKQGKSAEEKRKQSTRDLLQIALLEYVERLNSEIAEFEAGFAERFGDAWREEIALRVFGEEQVPRQRPDESIEDYRKRLERELVEQMLNPDGSIKDRYKNDPGLRPFAEWAQKINNRNAAVAIASDLADPETTSEQTVQLLQELENRRNAEQTIYAARALEGHEEQTGAVLDIDDNSRDSAGSKEQSASSHEFLKPIS